MSDTDSKDPPTSEPLVTSIFPEAGPIFSFRLKPLGEIKGDCYIVLDTNVLLVPFTTSKESLSQIQNTYGLLLAEKRLIIPGQVAREFAKNRAKKLSELYQQLSSKRDGLPPIQNGTYPLLDSIDEYRKSLEVEDQINTLQTQYRAALTAVLDHVKNWTWDDPVSSLYSAIFTSDVILDPAFDSEEIHKEVARRKQHGIPPGYKDAGVGDYLIWMTILHLGKEKQQSVIFVSGDEKADWYHQSNKQALYTRYELVDEFRRASGGHSFHMMRLSNLLDLYGASPTVVEEVRKEEIQTTVDETQKELVSLKGAWLVENAVIEFLKGFGIFKIARAESHSAVDYVMTRNDGLRVGVLVKYERSAHRFLRLLERGDISIADLTKEASVGILWIVLVGIKETAGMALLDVAHRLITDANTSIFIGYLGAENKFVLLDVE